MDGITRRDVLQHLEDRTYKRGAFADWPRTVGLRPAQTEIAALSVLFGFLTDVEARDLVNPCARPRARKYVRTMLETYRPKRKKVIPTEEELAAIFKAAADSTYLEARLKEKEQETARKRFAAAVKLTYYLAARPESEICPLTHGAVDIPDRSKVRSLTGDDRILGTVRFVHSKTGVDRRLPLHPEAEAALLEIMDERPKDAADVEAWSERPIFRSEDGTAWDRHSYRKPWRAMLKALAEDHPRRAGMVLRDLRTAANVRMRDAGTDGAIAAKLLGHSEEMNARACVEATDGAARRAILALWEGGNTCMSTGRPSQEPGHSFSRSHRSTAHT